MARRHALRSLTPQQRAQRRQDLLLAADALRGRIDADLTHLQPAADRVLVWVDAALWLRRRWLHTPRRRHLAVALAAVGGLFGAGRIGGFALRHRRWLRNALLAWRAWRALRA